jgi:hypothetical protein
MSGGRIRGVAEAISTCDDIEAGVARIRELLRSADTYRRRAFYQRSQPLYEDVMFSVERTWVGFATILEDLPE